MPYLSKDYQEGKLGGELYLNDSGSGLKGSVVPEGRPRRPGAGNTKSPAKQFVTAR